MGKRKISATISAAAPAPSTPQQRSAQHGMELFQHDVTILWRLNYKYHLRNHRSYKATWHPLQKQVFIELLALGGTTEAELEKKRKAARRTTGIVKLFSLKNNGKNKKIHAYCPSDDSCYEIVEVQIWNYHEGTEVVMIWPCKRLTGAELKEHEKEIKEHEADLKEIEDNPFHVCDEDLREERIKKMYKEALAIANQMVTKKTNELIKLKDQQKASDEQTKQEIEQLRKELKNARKDLADTLTEHNSRIEQHAREMKQKDQLLDTANAQISKLEGEKNRATEENRRLMGRIESSEEQARRSEAEKDRVSRENDKLQEKVGLLQRESNELKEENQSLQLKLADESKKVEQLKASTEENRRLVERIESSEEHARKLEAEKERVSRENELLREEVGSLQEQSKELNEGYQRLKQKLAEENNKVEQLKASTEENRRLMGRIESLEEHSKKLEAEKVRVSRENDELHEKVASLQRESKELNEGHQSLQLELTEKKKKVELLEAHGVEIKDVLFNQTLAQSALEGRIRTLNSINFALAKTIQHQKTHIERADAEKESLQKSIASVNKSQDEQSKLASAFQKEKQQWITHQNQLSIQQNAAHSQEIEMIRKERDDLQVKHDALEEQVKKQTEEMKTVKQERDSLQDEKKALGEQLSQLKLSHAQLAMTVQHAAPYVIRQDFLNMYAMPMYMPPIYPQWVPGMPVQAPEVNNAQVPQMQVNNDQVDED